MTQQVVLSREAIKNLVEILQLCSSVGIDSILIDDEAVRGVNEDKSCVIISDHNVPSFESNKIGLSRIGVLLARINLLMSDPKINIEAASNDKSEISQLTINGSNTKVQFRATSPTLVRAPKSINDDAHWMITIPQAQVDLLVNGIRTMGSKDVTFVKSGTTCTVDCSDGAKDTFSITLNKEIVWANPDKDEVTKENFVNRYPTDVLLPLIKQLTGKDVELLIGENGTLTATINGHPITVISLI